MKVAFRILLITGCLLCAAAACQNRGQQPTPTPGPVEATPEVISEGSSTNGHVVIPTAIPVPPQTYSTTLTLGNLDFVNPALTSAEPNLKATAFYFLRDRSRTVYEVCGARYTKAMKDIPSLVFSFLKNDASLADEEVFMALGAFPDQMDGNPGLLELHPLTEIDNIPHADWQAAVDSAWDTPFTNAYDAAVLMESIKKAVDALRDPNIPAESRVLVIFGDSMLDYPGGDKEWVKVMPDTYGDSALISLLEGDAGEADDVVLHYVQYDCLPANNTASDIYQGFWRNGIANWRKLQEPKASHDIDQIGREPLVVHKLLRIYGWMWYSNEDNEAAIRVNLDSERPPAWHAPSIVRGLLDSFLPSNSDSDPALWRRQRVHIVPSKIQVFDGQTVGTTEVHLPIPGYVRVVTIYMLGFDDNWCVREGDRNERECGNRLITDPPNIVLKSFTVRLEAPNEECAGSTLILESLPNTPLVYPATIWWTTTTNDNYPALRVTIDVEEIADSGLRVSSRTALDVGIDWEEELPSEREKDFLARCYEIDIVPAAPTAGASKEEAPLSAGDDFALPRTIQISFDPAADPTLGFELPLELVIHRKLNAPNFTETPHLGLETARPPANLPAVHFEYRPTLSGEDHFEERNEDDKAVYDYQIPLLYTEPGYYPPGSAPEKPELYLLAPSKKNVADSVCAAMPPDGPPVFLREADQWHARDLRKGTGEEHLVVKESLKDAPGEDGSLKIKLYKSEINDCNYQVLLIFWPNDGYEPIACSLGSGACVQSRAYALAADDALSMLIEPEG